MLKFSQFLLLEGGGKIKTESGAVSQPINWQKHPQGRKGVVADVHGFLSSLHDAVGGNSLFGRNKAAITAGTYGSAALIPAITIAANGRVTSITNTSVSIDASAVSSGTLPIARGGTNNKIGRAHV